MVVGVSEGYKKVLELVGVGYRVSNPVSYTHLDVYKRQEQGCTAASRLRLRIPSFTARYSSHRRNKPRY